MADADIRISARDETGAAFAAIRRSFADLETSALSFRGALGGLAVAAGAASLVNLGRDAIKAADEINKLSQKTAIGVESLSKLQYAAQLSDVSTESLATGLKGLNKAIDGNDDSFKQLGVSLRNNNGSLRGTDEVLGDIAEAFARSDDTAGKSAVALKLFGKAGVDLIPLLNQGRDGLRALGDEAARLGIVISADTARAAEAFNDNLTKLHANSRALGLALAETTLPALNRFTSELLEGQRAFGSFGEALFALGTMNPFKTQAENIRDLSAKAEELQRKLAAVKPDSGGRIGFRGDVPLGVGGPNDSEAAGLRRQLDIVQKQLKYEQARQRADIPTGGADTFDARDLALRRRRNIASSPDAPRVGGKDADGLTPELRRALAATARGVLDENQNNVDVANAYARIEIEKQAKADAEALKKVNDQAAVLAGILGQTQTGKLEALEAQQLVLNEALVKGTVNAKQFDEAFGVLDKQRNEVLGRTGDEFRNLSDAGKKAFEDLKTAAQGFGTKFTNTIVESVTRGKVEFGDLADSILSDILRITIQRSITDPLVNAGVDALGGLFKGAAGGAAVRPGGGGGGSDVYDTFLNVISKKALGGPVAAGMPYLVGERGPELFMPSQSGQIVPNDRLGAGAGPTFNITIGPGVDRAQVILAMNQAIDVALAKIAKARRQGPSPY